MPSDFSQFDSRNYPTVSPQDGYGEWAPTYEGSVYDAMDLGLLAHIESACWNRIERAVDLGCGTGRTGGWLKAHGVARVDGIDITAEMIARAEARRIYTTLELGDVLHTPFADQAYDLAIASLIDEHIRALGDLYREAARIVKIDGHFVIVGFHPQFIMASGMPTHFHRSTGEAVAIETHVHLVSDHVQAARSAGFALVEMHERIIDDEWLAKKPKWRQFAGQPISFAFVWRRGA